MPLIFLFKKMKFTILVNAPPFSKQGAASAYEFSKAVLAQGHSIVTLFFYRDGVQNANQFIQPPQDETNLAKQWQILGEQHHLNLIVCVTSAARRGVIDNIDAKQLELPAGNLASGFKLGGLGQLMDSIINSDRFIAFD